MQSLAPTTIRVYLSALRAWVISLGGQEPQIWTPRVHLACRAISRNHPLPIQAAPLTYDLLSSIIHLLSSSQDHLLIASALTLQFFACLRASELCTDLTNHIIPRRADVSFNSSSSSLIMLYTVHSSKTAPQGFTVHVGCSRTPICAVCIMRLYLTTFPAPSSDPLFQFSSSQHLTYNHYNRIIKHLVQAIGLDPSIYSSHSLRAGAATQAARAGLAPEAIKRLGRWKSQAYMLYMRPSPDAYADLAPALASSPLHH